MSDLIDKLVFNKVGVPLMQSFLDLSSTRQKLVAGNIANVATPGYKSKDIDFHGELKKIVGRSKHLEGTLTHPAHIPLGQSKEKGPEIIQPDTDYDNGVSNVDIDKEVADMAQNQIYYSAGARLLAGKFQGLKNAIKSK
jgi:flagellar basal-body rod protein FlgB